MVEKRNQIFECPRLGGRPFTDSGGRWWHPAGCKAVSLSDAVKLYGLIIEFKKVEPFSVSSGLSAARPCPAGPYFRVQSVSESRKRYADSPIFKSVSFDPGDDCPLPPPLVISVESLLGGSHRLTVYAGMSVPYLFLFLVSFFFWGGGGGGRRSWSVWLCFEPVSSLSHSQVTNGIIMVLLFIM